MRYQLYGQFNTEIKSIHFLRVSKALRLMFLRKKKKKKISYSTVKIKLHRPSENVHLFILWKAKFHYLKAGFAFSSMQEYALKLQ